MSVRLPAPVRAQLAAWTAAEHPREACGLLLGQRSRGAYLITRATAAANVAPEPRTRRFEVDPLDLIAADRLARAAGLEVVGIWHSHPGRTARASERDRRGAFPGWVYLILGKDAELRAWHLSGELLVELPLRVASSPTPLSAVRTP